MTTQCGFTASMARLEIYVKMARIERRREAIGRTEMTVVQIRRQERTFHHVR